MLDPKSHNAPEGQKPKPNNAILKPSYASQLKQDKPGQQEAIPRRAANGKMAVFMGRGKLQTKPKESASNDKLEKEADPATDNAVNHVTEPEVQKNPAPPSPSIKGNSDNSQQTIEPLETEMQANETEEEVQMKASEKELQSLVSDDENPNAQTATKEDAQVAEIVPENEPQLGVDDSVPLSGNPMESIPSSEEEANLNGDPTQKDAPEKSTNKAFNAEEKIAQMDASGNDGGGPKVLDLNASKLSLPDDNSKVYTDSLAAQKPIDFVIGVKGSSKAVHQAKLNEKNALDQSMPSVEQPTGLPTLKSKGKEKSKGKRKNQKPDNALTRGIQSTISALKPKGKVQGAKIKEKHEVPQTAWERMQSFFKVNFGASPTKRKEKRKGDFSALPTQSDINTHAGPRPNLDLSGAANPKQNDIHIQKSDTAVSKRGQEADKETYKYKGENDIYPDIDPVLITPKVKMSKTRIDAELNEELPPITDQIQTSFNDGIQEKMDAKLEPEMAKQQGEYDLMKAQDDLERKRTDLEINDKTEKTRKKQEEYQGTAKKQVSDHRETWRKENEAIKSEYSTKSAKEKSIIDSKIDQEVKDTDKKVDDEYTEAERLAEAERIKTEKDAKAEKKKAETQTKKKGFWDQLIDLVDQVFEAAQKALDQMFTALKKAVKLFIEKAKKAANRLIDRARNAIIGWIDKLGEKLKGLVNVVLAKYPELRDKINNKIDQAVDWAKEKVNQLADELKKFVSQLLDLLGKVLIALLDTFQLIISGLLEFMRMMTVGIIKLWRFQFTLSMAAYASPSHFKGALAEAGLGQNPDEPLKGIEIAHGQEAAWEEAMYGAPGDEQMTPAMVELLTKDHLNDEDVEVEPDPALELEPSILSQFSGMQDGETMDLGGSEDPVTTQQFQDSAADSAGNGIVSEEFLDSEGGEMPPDWRSMSNQEKLDYYNKQMLVESQNAGNGEPAPAQQAQTVDENSPEALVAKTGRLDFNQRLGFMGEQMMIGLEIFWSKWKWWIIGSLVALIIIAIVAAIFSFGTALAAIFEAVMLGLTIYFGAIAVGKAADHLWDYVSYSWEGNTAKAAKALALALAVIVVELLLDRILFGMVKIFKTVMRLLLNVLKKFGRFGRFIRNGVAIVKKNIKNFKSYVKRQIIVGLSKMRAAKNRLVVLMKEKTGSGIHKLSELRKQILSKFKFKRVWAERHGKYIEIWGEFNAKVLLIREEIDADGNTTRHHEIGNNGNLEGVQSRVTTEGDNSILGGVVDQSSKQIVVSDDFINQLDELRISDPVAYQSKLDELDNAIVNGMSKQELRKLVEAVGARNTQELRRGIASTGSSIPKFFQAHHVIPHELQKTFGAFFERIGFNIENGTINGIMVPPNSEILHASEFADEFSSYAFHLGSHPQYTTRVTNKIDEIQEAFNTGSITRQEAIDDIIELTETIKTAISQGNGNPINDIVF